jgi:hypothetical protein
MFPDRVGALGGELGEPLGFGVRQARDVLGAGRAGAELAKMNETLSSCRRASSSNSIGTRSACSAPMLDPTDSATWRLPSPWSLVSFATAFPFLPVLRTTRSINDRLSADGSRNRRRGFTAGEAAVIAIGAPLAVLKVLESFH